MGHSAEAKSSKSKSNRLWECQEATDRQCYIPTVCDSSPCCQQFYPEFEFKLLVSFQRESSDRKWRQHMESKPSTRTADPQEELQTAQIG